MTKIPTFDDDEREAEFTKLVLLQNYNPAEFHRDFAQLSPEDQALYREQQRAAARRVAEARAREASAAEAQREAEQQARAARDEVEAADPLRHALLHILNGLRSTSDFNRRDTTMVEAVNGAKRCLDRL